MKLRKHNISNPLFCKLSHTHMVGWFFLFSVARDREIIVKLLVFGISSFLHVLCHFAKCNLK